MFINAVAHVFCMPMCPVCDKWFSLQFAMLGHLRLCTDDRHVAYTGKTTSRKPVGVASTNRSRQTDSALWEAISRLESKFDTLNKTQQQMVTKPETPGVPVNLSKQTDSAVLEAISRLEAKFDAQNKPQQQTAIKTEIPVESADISRQNNSVLLDAVHRLDAKVDMINKSQQQRSIKTDTPVLPQPKKMTWWEYTNTDRTLKNQSAFAPADEYLNGLVESGFSPEYIRQRALEEH